MKKIFTILGMACALFSAKAQTWEDMGNAPIGAFQIESDNNGDVYILGPTDKSNIFVRRSWENSFVLLAGNGIVNDIAAYDGKLYGIGGENNNNNIYYNHNGSTWSVMSPKGVLTDLDYAGNMIFGSNNANNSLWQTTFNASTWTALTEKASKIAIGLDNTRIIQLNNVTKISIKGGAYTTISNNVEMASISIGNSVEYIWAVSTTGDVYQYNHTNNAWDKKNGTNIKSISIDSNEMLWALGNDNKVYKADLIDFKNRYTEWNLVLNNAISGATQIEVSDNGDLYLLGTNVSQKGNIYVKKPTDATFDFLVGGGIGKDIAVHSNRIFVTGTDDNIYELINQKWTLYTPARKLINIDFNGKALIGNDNAGNLFSHNLNPENNWNGYTGNGKSLSNATDGTMVCVNGLGSYIYDTTIANWKILSSNLTLTIITAGDRDNIWGINTSTGFIYNFNHEKNEWQRKLTVPSGAKSISIQENKAIYVLGKDNKVYKADLIPVVITATEKENNSETIAYPNPATNTIHFVGQGELFNLNGQKVAQGENSINISALTNGIYVLKVGAFTQKIIKE